jgi:hypothetical protein
MKEALVSLAAPYGRVFPEKLRVSQLLKKLFASSGIRNFTTRPCAERHSCYSVKDSEDVLQNDVNRPEF